MPIIFSNTTNNGEQISTYSSYSDYVCVCLTFSTLKMRFTLHNIHKKNTEKMHIVQEFGNQYPSQGTLFVAAKKQMKIQKKNMQEYNQTCITHAIRVAFTLEKLLFFCLTLPLTAFSSFLSQSQRSVIVFPSVFTVYFSRCFLTFHFATFFF